MSVLGRISWWLLIAGTTGVLAAPFAASAHQLALVESGGRTYWLSVGYGGNTDQLAEVGRLTALTFRVFAPDPARPTDFSATRVTEVPGFEDSLQVELIAGGRRKILNFVRRQRSGNIPFVAFLPTVEGTYAYRFFGTINAAPLDITFTCNPDGHPALTSTPIPPTVAGETVLRATSSGFGCPTRPLAEPFPGETTPEEEARRQFGANLDRTEAALADLRDAHRLTRLAAMGAAVLGLTGVILALWAVGRGRSQTPYG